MRGERHRQVFGEVLEAYADAAQEAGDLVYLGKHILDASSITLQVFVELSEKILPDLALVPELNA